MESICTGSLPIGQEPLNAVNVDIGGLEVLKLCLCRSEQGWPCGMQVKRPCPEPYAGRRQAERKWLGAVTISIILLGCFGNKVDTGPWLLGLAPKLLPSCSRGCAGWAKLGGHPTTGLKGK